MVKNFFVSMSMTMVSLFLPILVVKRMHFVNSAYYMVLSCPPTLPTMIAFENIHLLYKGRINTDMQLTIPMTEIKRLKHIISHVGAVGGEWYK